MSQGRAGSEGEKMKGIKFNNCSDCPDNYMCEIIHQGGPIDFSILHPDCTLADWPEVSGKELWLSLCDFYACSDCHDRRYPECDEKKCPAKGIYHLITDGMTSIGVIVKEEKDGK
jgi:hypothetical protein